MDDLLLHIGKRVRLNRKLRRVSLGELGARIYKSKATVSKYESGQIAIDISTLYQIASALNVEVTDLLYFGQRVNPAPTGGKNPFGEDARLHVYSYGGRGKVNYSLLELDNATENNEVLCKFYYRLPPSGSLEQCDFFYSGKMFCHDTLITFHLCNEFNAIERLQLCFIKLLSRSEILTGMLSGLSAELVKPIAYKVLLTRKKISDSLAMEMLLIDAVDFRQFKKEQIFSV